MSAVRNLKKTKLSDASATWDGLSVAHIERRSSLKASSLSNPANPKCILLSMPFDIIHEILGHLHPMDLLYLAWTNKYLRDFLMSRRKSKAVWRSARRNIKGLPDCPVNLSEAEYANLAFNPYCHNCLKPGSHEVVWEYSARYCTNCLYINDVTWMDNWVDRHFESVIGRGSDFKWAAYLAYYMLNEYTPIYQRTACEELARQVSELRKDEDALDAYLVDLQDLVESIRPHAKACRKWYKKFLDRRLRSIIEKLREEEEWDADLNEMSEGDFAPLKKHTNVVLPKVLSNDEWQEIRGEIVASMAEYRDARLRRERAALIQRRLLDLRRVVCKLQLGDRGFRTPEQDFGPRFADFALMPEFRTLVEAPSDMDIKRSTFRRKCAELPALFDRFDAGREAQLARLLAERLGRPADAPSTDILKLAVAWFHCDQCRRYVRCPGVFAHQCQRPYYHRTDREDYEDAYIYDVAKASTFHAWSTTKLHPIPEEDLAALRALIAACGLDPARATAEEMDALDLRVTCDEIPVPYASKSEGKLVMNWRRAVLSLPMIQGGNPVKWVRASDADKRRALSLEAKAHQALLMKPKHQKFLQCALCDEPWWLVTESHGDAFLVADHLRRNHHISMAEIHSKGVYMYMHPDGVPETPEVWLPFL